MLYNYAMDKEIYKLRRITASELERIEQLPTRRDRRLAASALLRYNTVMTRNLQHERLIHLMVTILFAAIMIGSWLGLLAWFSADNGQYDLVTWLMIAAVALIAGLEIGYIRYYYLLENGIAKLYPQERQIYDLIEDNIE